MGFSLTTAQVAEQFSISQSTLRKMRKAGFLKPGVDFRAMGLGTQKPRLAWNPDALDKTLTLRSKRVLA